MKRRIYIGFIYYLTLIYLEIVFRVVCTENIFPITFINNLIFLLPVTLFLIIISSLLTPKVNAIIAKIIIFILCLWYAVCLVFKNKFGVYFSLSAIGLANQLKSFIHDTISTIGNNIIYIIILFIPFILIIIFRKKIIYPQLNSKYLLATTLCMVVSYLFFVASIHINKNESYSLYNLYYQVDNHALTVEKLGLMPSTIIEIKRNILGFEEKLNEPFYIPEIDEDIKDEPKELGSNILDIDFSKLSSQTKDELLIQMNDYFAQDPGTKKNEYTGMYEGKNLIVFMAESFSPIAITQELTPTLYKLTNESFVFENFYSPVILSTIGGEFQELTGLYPNLGLLTNVWRKGKNYYPYGFANVFKELDYQTYAYHNNQYNFQARDKYLKSLGFDNYLGCYNGLEKRINCNIWPQSDVEMIEKTVDDYLKNDQPFMVYYATVSGHMAYNWGNRMSAKHKEAVKDLPYSEEVKAYIATQIELDQALELLITKLEESDKLDDTVIALVADHYPYDLSVDQVNEASSYERDSIVEINHSNFILWNSTTKTTKISKIGSQIDVLPTLLNLFGVEYDSRLIIGKDILADNEGLAIFSNNSWISDLGVYYSNSNKFIPKENIEVPDNYVENMNKIVRTKINMSKYIMQEDYYRYVFSK